MAEKKPPQGLENSTDSESRNRAKRVSSMSDQLYRIQEDSMKHSTRLREDIRNIQKSTETFNKTSKSKIIKANIPEINKTIGRLNYTIGTMASGMKNITDSTAKATGSIIRQYGNLIANQKQDNFQEKLMKGLEEMKIALLGVESLVSVELRKFLAEHPFIKTMISFGKTLKSGLKFFFGMRGSYGSDISRAVSVGNVFQKVTNILSLLYVGTMTRLDTLIELQGGDPKRRKTWTMYSKARDWLKGERDKESFTDSIIRKWKLDKSDLMEALALIKGSKKLGGIYRAGEKAKDYTKEKASTAGKFILSKFKRDKEGSERVGEKAKDYTKEKASTAGKFILSKFKRDKEGSDKTGKVSIDERQLNELKKIRKSSSSIEESAEVANKEKTKKGFWNYFIIIGSILKNFLLKGPILVALGGAIGLGIYDAFKGKDLAKEWLGEKTPLTKSITSLSSFLGGTSKPGSLFNLLKGFSKGTGIGAAIGMLIGSSGGPAGSIMGGVMGGMIGSMIGTALADIGGKSIAKTIQEFTDLITGKRSIIDLWKGQQDKTSTEAKLEKLRRIMTPKSFSLLNNDPSKFAKLTHPVTGVLRRDITTGLWKIKDKKDLKSIGPRISRGKIIDPLSEGLLKGHTSAEEDAIMKKRKGAIIEQYKINRQLLNESLSSREKKNLKEIMNGIINQNNILMNNNSTTNSSSQSNVQTAPAEASGYTSSFSSGNMYANVVLHCDA